MKGNQQWFNPKLLSNKRDFSSVYSHYLASNPVVWHKAISLASITTSAITTPELTAPYSTQNTSIGTIIVEKLFVKYTLYAIDKTRQKSKPIEISVNLLLDDYVNAPSLAKLITLSTPLHTQTGRHHNQADVDAFKFIAVAGGRYTFSSTSDVKMTLLDVTDHSSGVPVNLVSVDTPSVIPPVNTVVVSPPSELNAPSLPGTGEITNPIEQAHEAFGISVPVGIARTHHKIKWWLSNEESKRWSDKRSGHLL